MANPESRGNVSVRNRRLPHWEAEGAIYFVTFRLADSLPEAILESRRWEREDIPKTAEMLQRDLTWVEEQRMDELYGEQAQVYLDHGEGACQLRNPAIAGMVRDALLHFEGQRYHLLAWCIMPNHVHAIVCLLAGNKLSAIMHSWKSYTAKEANRLLRRKQPFWQREYYDRMIRNQAELDHAISYVLDNPVTAGLEDWPWVGRNEK